MKDAAVYPEKAEVPKAVTALATQVDDDDGHALAIYQEPEGDHWQIFCLLPLSKVEPTPYQRNLSKTHVKRLQEVLKKLDRFVDPIVAISPRPGVYWTPNGNHRREALSRLKAKLIPAILIPDPQVAFQILALNTEKAHNLKEKSLEVIRMARGLVEEGSREGEETYAFQFEAPHFLTLGAPLRGKRPIRRGGLRPDPQARGQVSENSAAQGPRGARAASGTGTGGRRDAHGGRAEAQEAGDQSPLRQELRPRPHDAAQPAAEDASLVRSDVREAHR